MGDPRAVRPPAVYPLTVTLGVTGAFLRFTESMLRIWTGGPHA